MKITRRQLKRIIQEELRTVLNEQGTLERAGRSADSYFSGETGGLVGAQPSLTPYGDLNVDPRLAPTRNIPRGGPVGMLEPWQRQAVSDAQRERQRDFVADQFPDLEAEYYDRRRGPNRFEVEALIAANPKDRDRIMDLVNVPPPPAYMGPAPTPPQRRKKMRNRKGKDK